MKVLLYKDNLSTGRGADHLICAQAAGLAEKGHDVTLATCPTGMAFTFKVSENVKVEFVERTAVRNFAASFDVCIAAGSNEILDLTLCGRARPLVKTATEMLLAPRGFFKWKRFFRNQRIKRAFNLSDVLVILCPSYEKDVRKFAPDPGIVTIAEWPDVREPTEGELRGEHRRKVIICPAAINRHKNQLLLIEAFARLAEDFPDWELHLYGRANRSYGARCHKAASRAGLADRIRFLPFTEDLPSVYAGAEIMAFPSLLEGFPLTILEGAKFGLPAVVVKELPGVDDMIENGENGIVSRNNVNEYAASLQRLMEDGEFRARLGVGARERCTRRYSRELIMEQWDSLVRQIGNR